MLEDLKKKVVLIAQSAEKNALCKHKAGNFSLKDPESGYILISPSGIARDELTYQDIAVVSPEGGIVELETKAKPSGELLMHLMPYKCRKDVMGVVHTHSHYATVFAVKAREIKPIVLESLIYGAKTPVAKFSIPGTQQLADSIVDPLKTADACLLEKHGVLTVGKSLDDAYLKALYLEDVAKIYYHALLMGGEPEAISQEILNTLKMA